MRLKNKVAIITGSARGIGKAIASGFSSEGAKVVIVDLLEEESAKIVREIEASGAEAFAIKTDISKMEEVNTMVKQTLDKFGKIDILVNNAAIFLPGSLLEITEEQWTKVIDVNLGGTFRCTQAVAREMIKNKYGKIINVATGLALLGIPALHDYIASKGGIISFTKCCASELGSKGINVNAFFPGLTVTEGTSDLYSEEFLKMEEGRASLGRLGNPKDYIGIAVFLASDESNYVNGAIMPIDGGLTNIYSSA